MSDFPLDPGHEWRTMMCANCGHSFKVPVPCKDRFCSVCSCVRLSKTRRKLKALCERQKRSGKGRIRFLTLTITSHDDLYMMVKILQRSFRKARQSKSWKKRVAGGASVIEITHSENGWHAHIHALICGTFFPFESMLKVWKKASPGQGVWLKDVPQDKLVKYLTKYITKPDSSLSEQQRDAVNSSLKGTRLFQPFGDWHGWMKDIKLSQPICKLCNVAAGFISEWDIPKPETPCFIYDRRPARASPVETDPF